MKHTETVSILAMGAIGEGDHQAARESLDELSLQELREVIALATMLNYLANQTIDDKPRDLDAEARGVRFSLRDAEDTPE